jgi:hypothetical protein
MRKSKTRKKDRERERERERIREKAKRGGSTPSFPGVDVAL